MILRRLLIICAVMAMGFATASAEIRGDANGDGKVDVSDVNTIINMMLGKAEVTDVGDATHDGTVDVSDVNYVVNVMLGKITPKTFETIDELYQASTHAATR